MKRHIILQFVLFLMFLGFSGNALSQKMAFDGKLGLSFFTGNGSSTGLLLGGGLDIPFQERLYIRPELNITTHNGTPIELGGKLKYVLPSSSPTMELFVDGGIGVWFYSGGSAFGIDGGAGALFPLSGTNLKIPAEVRLGPVFESGNSILQIALTTGIRLDLP